MTDLIKGSTCNSFSSGELKCWKRYGLDISYRPDLMFSHFVRAQDNETLSKYLCHYFVVLLIIDINHLNGVIDLSCLFSFFMKKRSNKKCSDWPDDDIIACFTPVHQIMQHHHPHWPWDGPHCQTLNLLLNLDLLIITTLLRLATWWVQKNLGTCNLQNSLFWKINVYIK